MHLPEVCVVISSLIMVVLADAPKLISYMDISQQNNNFKCLDPQPRIVDICVNETNKATNETNQTTNVTNQTCVTNRKVPVVLHKCDKCSGYCKSPNTCRAAKSETVMLQVRQDCWIAAKNHTKCKCVPPAKIVDNRSPCMDEITASCNTTWNQSDIGTTKT